MSALEVNTNTNDPILEYDTTLSWCNRTACRFPRNVFRGDQSELGARHTRDQTGRDQTERDQTEGESMQTLMERMNDDMPPHTSLVADITPNSPHVKYMPSDQALTSRNVNHRDTTFHGVDFSTMNFGDGDVVADPLLQSPKQVALSPFGEPESWVPVDAMGDISPIILPFEGIGDEDAADTQLGDVIDKTFDLGPLQQQTLVTEVYNSLQSPSHSNTWIPSLHPSPAAENYANQNETTADDDAESVYSLIWLTDSEEEEEEEEGVAKEGDVEDMPPLTSTTVMKPIPPEGMLLPSGWDSLSAYEQKRLINIHANEHVLFNLGIKEDMPVKETKKKAVPRRKKVVEELLPTRSSGRITMPVQSYSDDHAFDGQSDGVVQSTPKNARSARGQGRNKVARGDVSGNSWVNTSTDGVYEQQLLQEDQETMATLYPNLWFNVDGAPTSGNVGLKVEQLPKEMIETLAPHIDDIDRNEVEPLTGQKLYAHVTPQPGKGKGWQVQMWKHAVGNMVRVGLTDESLLGAIMICLADIDDRLFNQAQMYSFLYYVVTHGLPAWQKWLTEVGDRITIVNPRQRRRQGGKKVKTAGHKRAEIFADSFLNFEDQGDDTGESDAKKDSRKKKRKTDRAQRGLLAAAATSFNDTVVSPSRQTSTGPFNPSPMEWPMPEQTTQNPLGWSLKQFEEMMQNDIDEDDEELLRTGIGD